MNTGKLLAGIGGALLVVGLTGCGAGSEEAAPTAASPSSATVPPATPSTESASPSPKAMSAAEVGEALVSAVPQAKVVKIYTEEDDPNNLLGRPGGYSSKMAFSDSRVKKDDLQGSDKDAIDRGGSVEVYDDPARAKARAKYIATVQQDTPLLGTEYHYLSGGILVRVTGNLPPKVAREYEAALKVIAP